MSDLLKCTHSSLVYSIFKASFGVNNQVENLNLDNNIKSKSLPLLSINHFKGIHFRPKTGT